MATCFINVYCHKKLKNNQNLLFNYLIHNSIMNFIQKQLLFLNKYTKSISNEKLYHIIHTTENIQRINSLLEMEKDLQIHSIKTYETIMYDVNHNLKMIEGTTYNDAWNYISSLGLIKQINKHFFFIKLLDSFVIVRVFPISSLHVYDNNVYFYNFTIRFNMYTINHNTNLSEYFNKLDMSYISNELITYIINETHSHKMAIKIQKKCHNWLWKPVCNDGKCGINVRLAWNELDKKQQNTKY